MSHQKVNVHFFFFHLALRIQHCVHILRFFSTEKWIKATDFVTFHIAYTHFFIIHNTHNRHNLKTRLLIMVDASFLFVRSTIFLAVGSLRVQNQDKQLTKMKKNKTIYIFYINCTTFQSQRAYASESPVWTT